MESLTMKRIQILYPIVAFVAALLPLVGLAFEIQPQLGHTGYVTSVVYSPDGLYLASASTDDTVKLWEVSSGKELRTFRGHTDDVRSIAFSPDGKYIASGSWDRTVRL